MKKNKLLGFKDILKLTSKRFSRNFEYLPVLNKAGEEVGYAEREVCHKLGLTHRVVYLILENQKKELLVQVRGDFKQGRLDLPVGGHINIQDKSILSALEREAFEELGIKVSKKRLKKITIYNRYKDDNLAKPKEINSEERHLYYYKLNLAEEKELSKNFKNRIEKKLVTNIIWQNVNSVIKACDDSRVADGLNSSIIHYVVWKTKFC